MRITLAAVGKVRAKHFAEACDDYARRLARYSTFRLVEVKDVRGRPPSDTAARESAALEEAVPRGAYLVVLDERGECVRSAELAARMQQSANRGVSEWAFCVGGAEGHAPELRSRADWVWSLSPLTLPHELARVVLLEQLYRALTICRGESYHREG